MPEHYAIKQFCAFRILSGNIPHSVLAGFRFVSRKKDGNIFLVAFYECEDDFDLESLEHDRLYCSKDAWIGVRPRCIRIGGPNGQDDYDDNGDGDEDDTEDGDDAEEEEDEDEDEDGDDVEDDNNTGRNGNGT